MDEVRHYDPERVQEIFGLRGRYGAPPDWSGEELRCCCPFPHFKPDVGTYYVTDKESFAVNLVTGKWNCRSCGRAGPNLDSLASGLKVELPLLFRTAHTAPGRDEFSDFGPHYIDAISGNRELAIEYMRSRGISESTVDRFQIGANRDGSEIYFPQFDHGGNLVAWSTRRKEGTPKWMLHPTVDVLYGCHVAQGPIGCVVESPIDVLKLFEWGYPAVATCGASTPRWQSEAVLDMFTSVVLIPHNDGAGASWMLKLMNRLLDRCILYGIRLPPEFGDVGDIPSPDVFHEAFSGKKMLKKIPETSKTPRKNN